MGNISGNSSIGSIGRKSTVNSPRKWFPLSIYRSYKSNDCRPLSIRINCGRSTVDGGLSISILRFRQFLEIITAGGALVHLGYLHRLAVEQHAGEGREPAFVLLGNRYRFQGVFFTNGAGHAFQLPFYCLVHQVPGPVNVGIVHHQLHAAQGRAEQGVDGNDILIFQMAVDIVITQHAEHNIGFYVIVKRA